MNLSKTLMSVGAGALSLAVLAGTASAQSLIFQHGTETGSRFNPQGTALPGGYTTANTIAFTNCVFGGGNTSANLSSFTFGIRQLAGALDTSMRVYIAEMDGTGNLVTSSVRDLGLVSIQGSAASQTRLVTVNAPAGTSINMTDLAGASNPGFSGFFVGIRFEGPNAASGSHGWRVTNAPAVGSAFNYFAAYDPTVPINGNWSFNAPTPSYLYLDVTGTLVPAPGAIALLGLAGLSRSRRRR